MYRFLIVEHDQSEGLRFTARKVQIPEGEARMLPAFEAISLGLMPARVTLDEQTTKPDTIRMTYRSAAARKLLVGDPNDFACDDHDPFDIAHVGCHHPADTYRYTWYEAPVNRPVHAAFIERHFQLGSRTHGHRKELRAFSHQMTMQGKMLRLPADTGFAQEKACKASFHSTWWQP